MPIALLTLLFTGLPWLGPAADTPTARSPRETLGAFVGVWDLELVAEPETFGERGGPGRGTMSCSWGLLESWVDCTLDAKYAGMGRYALKLVLYPAGRAGSYGAFVTNSPRHLPARTPRSEPGRGALTA